MKTFIQFINEAKQHNEPLELVTPIDIFDYNKKINEEFLTEAISSNDKGVLHEILTGKHLNGGKHMSPDAEKKHDEIKSKITKEEYDNHNKLAKITANHIHHHLGGDVHSVHWSSKPGDIHRITGVNETQQENPSDIIIRHHNGSHTGISLKITQKKNGKVPVGNPGARQTDEQLGVSTAHHYAEAKEKFHNAHPETRGKTNVQIKKDIKADAKKKETAEKHSNEAITKIRDTWHDRLSKMSSEELSHHIRHNLLHAKATKTKMYKATTGGTPENHSVQIEHPHTSHDHILNDHKNITVEKSGNNSIIFKHKGKTFLKHRLKPESTPIASALKGSAE